jgi:transposase
MSQGRYKKGHSRHQTMLLPNAVEDYVSEDNPVRAIDAYVDSLNLGNMGFTNAQRGVQKGQPPFDPSDLMKLYLYGYLNRIRSSRRLEKETYRNLEVIWLIRGIQPTYKTIADFRKNNHSAIIEVNKDFVLLCKELDLYGGELVAIDGSFVKANASKSSIYTRTNVKKRLAEIEKDIFTYIDEINKNDENEQSNETVNEDRQLEEKLEKLKERQQHCKDVLSQIEASDDTQISMTDEDARLLSKNGVNMAGYNVQSAVDDKHKLLVACDVVNDRNDCAQLYPMAEKAKEALEVDELKTAADAGYYNQPQIKNCLDANITPYVPRPDRGKADREKGRFERKDFIFDEEQNAYRCPAGQYLTHRTNQDKDGKKMLIYNAPSSTCKQCHLKDKCLEGKSPYRRISRYEHEDIIEAHDERMEKDGKAYMKKRASAVEHPFGTLKVWWGWTHFLMRGIEKVKAEMNLFMLSYNFKRVLNIIGVEGLRAYCAKRNARSPEKGLCNNFLTIFLYMTACYAIYLITFARRVAVGKISPRKISMELKCVM